MKSRPPNWLNEPCMPKSLLRLLVSGAKSKISEVDKGVMIPKPTPKSNRINSSNRKSFTNPPATPNTKKSVMPVSKSFFLSILAVRRAEYSPTGIITNVGKVNTSLACVSEMCGNASRMAAKAGDTAVGAMIVSTDTDKIEKACPH